MTDRQTAALWLVPVAYVIAYRVLGFLVWRAMLAFGNPVLLSAAPSLLVAGACAFAAASLCVYVHARVAGPLDVRRAFLMAAIAFPLFLIAQLLTAGVGFTGYYGAVPLQAVLNFAVVVAALPFAAAIMAPRVPAPGAQPGDPRPRQPAWLVFLRVIVALASVAGLLAGGLFVLIVAGFGGLKPLGSDAPVFWAAIVALAMLAFCFACAVGLLRRVMRPAPVIVTVAFLPVVGWLFTEGRGAAWLAGWVVLYVGAFWAMCRGMEAHA